MKNKKSTITSGILAVHKPEGISSAKAVARVKHLLKAKKVGHTGTLDPFATGVLLCCINKATKIAQYFLHGSKAYRAVIRLGEETDTLDPTGQVVDRVEEAVVKGLDKNEIIAAVNGFSGVQDQVPPSFSALKKDGQPLYKLARKGIHVEKPARRIEVFKIEVLAIDLPSVEIDVACSSGTYIRSIARDIGRQLGCGGHLTRLCRTRASQFTLENAIDPDKIDRACAIESIVPLSEALDFLPAIEVGPELEKKIAHGQRLSAGQMGVNAQEYEDGDSIRLIDEKSNLLAIVRFDKMKQTYNYSCVFSA